MLGTLLGWLLGDLLDAVLVGPLLGEPLGRVLVDKLGVSLGVRLGDLQVCPDMAKCRAHVEAIAPYDYQLYRHVQQAFTQRVVRLGQPFAESLERFRDTRSKSALGVCDPSRDAPAASRCCCADRLPCFNLTGREAAAMCRIMGLPITTGKLEEKRQRVFLNLPNYTKSVSHPGLSEDLPSGDESEESDDDGLC